MSWDWVDSDNFAIDHFVVYRGDTAIGTVTAQQLNGIPYENTAGVYTYKVVAYDVSGNASPDSQIVTITLPDMSAYSAYMAWREFYFGDNPQYASDDSDGDGVDNYTEFLLGTDPTRIPGTQWVEAGQVAYSKATIKWDKVFAENTNVTYTIYRNGEAVGTSNSESFTDSGLTPGVFYTYTVSAVNNDTGVETEPGMALTLRTGAVVEFANSDKVRQVVDSLTPVNINEHTATTLIAAVKSGFEAVFGTSIAFTVVNEDILQDFVAAELELLGTEEDALTNAEKLAARTELRDFLDQHYNGNSFEHVYINSKLSELAEKHYQRGNITAALELFEASLFYLKDCENIVSGTLSRLGRIKLDAINDNSTNAEIIAALDASRDQYLRFFNYFAESSTNHALFSYTRPASEYFKYFPRLLTYDNYSTSVFTSANDLAQAALNIDSSALIQARADNIAAWELVPLKITIRNASGDVLSGTITIENISGNDNATKKVYYSTENISADNRSYNFTYNTVEIPTYSGHHYDMKIEIPGFDAISIANIAHKKGKKYIYINTTIPAVSSTEKEYSEIIFIMDVDLSLDSDGDGIPDSVEVMLGLNKDDPTDALADPDGDGMTNLEEYLQGYDIYTYTRIVYADVANGSDANDGLSAAAAKQSIKAAVDAAKTIGNENVVMVAPGTYTGVNNRNMNFGGYDIKLRSIGGATVTVVDVEKGGHFLVLGS
ncbi:MAG: hypothetical protein JXR78_15625, partial [Victivallales bacterium]|nr:hypothetical protein [Victivallales bacterium]